MAVRAYLAAQFGISKLPMHVLTFNKRVQKHNPAVCKVSLIRATHVYSLHSLLLLEEGPFSFTVIG